jgi:hypothetical protein
LRLLGGVTNSTAVDDVIPALGVVSLPNAAGALCGAPSVVGAFCVALGVEGA